MDGHAQRIAHETIARSVSVLMSNRSSGMACVLRLSQSNVERGGLGIPVVFIIKRRFAVMAMLYIY